MIRIVLEKPARLESEEREERITTMLGLIHKIDLLVMLRLVRVLTILLTE